MEAHTRGAGEEGWVFGGLARFVMVARDMDTGEATKVASLVPETKQQHNLYALGHYNKSAAQALLTQFLASACLPSVSSSCGPCSKAASQGLPILMYQSKMMTER